MRIAAYTCCKNEGILLKDWADCMRPAVDELVALVDVDSTDCSNAVAHRYFDRVYRVRFADSFGDLLTLGLHLCWPAQYALYLDCDERLIENWRGQLRCFATWEAAPRNAAIALRRMRWARWGWQDLMEEGPDWQVRLVPVVHQARYAGRVHPCFTGAPIIENNTGLIIDHYHDCAKDEAAIAERQRLYQKLAKLDHKAVEGGQDLDARCICGHERSAHVGAFEYVKPPFGCALTFCNCVSFSEVR